MWICIKILGKQFCFWIPIYYQIPIIRIPEPDPGPYRGFMVDATILATIQEASKHITDQTVRHAIQGGLSAGIKSMQTKVGDDFAISYDAPKQG